MLKMLYDDQLAVLTETNQWGSSFRGDNPFGRASGLFAGFLNSSLGYLIALRSLFAFVANVLEFFVRQMLNSNKRVSSRANSYQFVQLDLNGSAIPILGVLY